MHIKLLDLYKEARDVFVKPKIRFYCGPWRKDPSLPVWRHGPIIKLYKHQDLAPVNPLHGRKSLRNFKVYPVTDNVHVKIGTKTCYRNDGTSYECDCYDISSHKLPKGYHNWDYAWRRDIRKKLHKYRLDWIKPIIQLPIWLSFRIFNLNTVWKTKYEDYRYEFPGQFTIVIFGFSFTWYTQAPVNIKECWTGNDDYWESMLTYLDCKSIKDTNLKMGMWSANDGSYYRFSPDFLKEPYKSELKQLQYDSPGSK